MILFENRASKILFNILNSINKKGIFLLPLNICPIVPITFLKAKVPFEFIDINLDDLCINQEKVLERIKKGNILGVLFAHTYGIELDLEDFFKQIKCLDEEIFIIDDRCLNKPVFGIDIQKSFADLVLFSTGYVKYVDLNWGGYGFLKQKHTYKSIDLNYEAKHLDDLIQTLEKSIKNQSYFTYKDSNWLGSLEKPFNSFLEYKNQILEKLPKVENHRKQLDEIYTSNIPEHLHLGKEFNNWRFSILVDNKDALLKEIFEKKLFASSHYSAVDYLFLDKKISNSNTNIISSRIVNLFNDFRFTKQMAYDITQIINGMNHD